MRELQSKATETTNNGQLYTPATIHGPFCELSGAQEFTLHMTSTEVCKRQELHEGYVTIGRFPSILSKKINLSCYLVLISRGKRT